MTSNALPQLSALNLNRLNQDERGALGGISEVVIFRLPMNIRFRGITVREGLLLRGPHGWGECAPFWNYDPRESAVWLSSALRQANTPPPVPLRLRVPVNVTVPVCEPQVALGRLSAQPGCYTAKVKVADPGFLTDEDVVRVRTVADYLGDKYGQDARVRIDANTAWTVDEAAHALERLDRAAAGAGGLEYAEQPVKTALELAELKKRTSVPLAADESIRRSPDPLAVKHLGAADVAVLKVAPLGGTQRAAALSAQLGLPPVVSSALDTSVGIAEGVLLAAELPTLPYACGLNTATMFAADVVEEPLVARDGALDVGRALEVRAGELTSHSRALEDETCEKWEVRLRQMVTHLGEELR